MPSPVTDRVISERYIIKGRLGRGGMGVVWEAHDEVLGRRVAVKEVEPPTSLSPAEQDALRQRVLREARAAAQLGHPGVVTVYDVLQEEGIAYIVMELIEAPSLADLVAEKGPLDAERTARIGLALLDALEVAHRNGIVHRDVKPANVMIDAEGRVKLADFGIASVKGDPKITATGLVLGSPSYMAPEQASLGRAGPEGDLWALGATMYFAVEGRPPFDKGQAIPTLTAVVHDEPAPAVRAGPLAPVLDALLRKQPDERPAHERLRQMLRDVESSPGAATIAPAAAPTAPRVAEPRSAAATRPAVSSRGMRWVALVGAAAALVALLAFLLPRWIGPGGDEDRRRARSERAGGAGATEEQPGRERAAVPADWITYKDDEVGYRIAHPPDWEVVDLGDTRTDFRDPESSTYLRVDWTDTPGSSPEAAWRSFETTFAAEHDDYSRVRIESTTFKGMDAAEWEFTYSEGGTTLRAIDLGFVTSDRSYGLALNFQTAAEDWAASQPVFEAFKEGFQPP